MIPHPYATVMLLSTGTWDTGAPSLEQQQPKQTGRLLDELQEGIPEMAANSVPYSLLAMLPMSLGAEEQCKCSNKPFKGKPGVLIKNDS